MARWLKTVSTNALGEQVYPKRRSYGRQPVWEFEDEYVFILQKEVYRKAGIFHWKPAYDRGELGRQGISFNKRVFAKIVNSDKDFLIFDKKRKRVFRFNDLDAINVARAGSKEMYEQGDKDGYALKEERGGTELVVVPLDAFSKDSLQRVSDKIKERY